MLVFFFWKYKLIKNRLGFLNSTFILVQSLTRRTGLRWKNTRLAPVSYVCTWMMIPDRDTRLRKSNIRINIRCLSFYLSNSVTWFRINTIPISYIRIGIGERMHCDAFHNIPRRKRLDNFLVFKRKQQEVSTIIAFFFLLIFRHRPLPTCLCHQHSNTPKM